MAELLEQKQLRVEVLESLDDLQLLREGDVISLRCGRYDGFGVVLKEGESSSVIRCREYYNGGGILKYSLNDKGKLKLWGRTLIIPLETIREVITYSENLDYYSKLRKLLTSRGLALGDI